VGEGGLCAVGEGAGYMKAMTVGLALLVAACSPATASETEFTKQMLAKFQQQYPRSKFDVLEQLTLRKDAGLDSEAHINLHRIWLYCQNVPEECDRAKTDYVRKTSTELPAEATADQLRIMVRGEDYINYVRGLETDAKKDLGPSSVYEKIGDDLYIVVAADYKDRIGLVGEKRLRELKLDRNAAFKLAAEQTRPSLPTIPNPSHFKTQATAFEGEAYLSALLYDRDAWRRISDEVGPDLLVTVVSDQFVFAGLMPDGPKLEDFKKTVIEDCAQQERCISDKVYRFRNDRWVISR
jgi:hypothetical protein